MKQRRLGRGLSGLISRTDEEVAEEQQAASSEASERTEGPMVAEPERGPVRTLAVDEIRVNPYQPRTAFSEEGIDELKTSIEKHGVLQPLVVRTSEEGYELIAGERRLRAARAVGLVKVPVVLRAASDEEMQALALVENVQRVDLNAMEKARAIRSMMANFGLTQDQVAKEVGKARTTIANFVRLLELPPEVQQFVEGGDLSGAQARAILRAKSVEARIRLAEQAVEHGWSVREIERRTKEAKPAAGPSVAVGGGGADPYLRDIETRLERALVAPVALRKKKQGGLLEIRWNDPNDLDRLIEMIESLGS